jgi:hypothetical protein
MYLLGVCFFACAKERSEQFNKIAIKKVFVFIIVIVLSF